MSHISSPHFLRSRSIQSIFFNPRLRNRAEAQEPVVELLQTPATSGNKPLMQTRVLQPAQPVTHRHGRRGSVPIHVRLGTRAGEAEISLHVPHGLLVSVAARLQSQ